MATTANPTPAQMQAISSPKQQFLSAFEKEHATTLRVLRAYPSDKLDFKPHPKCGTARQLAWTLVMGQMMIQKALTTGFDWAAPQAAPPQPPESLDAIIAALDEGHKRAVDIVRGVRDEQLLETVKFFVAPKTLGDIPKIEFIWKFLCDQIHHRGQLSIYLRMVDGKVPSIYGPSADEPWM